MNFLNFLNKSTTVENIFKSDADLALYLIPGEEVEVAFKSARGFAVFTPKRLILINKQGVVTSKKEYQSIPYGKIVMFTADYKGMLDREAELRIQLQGTEELITLKFGDNDELAGVQKGLATLVCD